jgi:NADH dehydrogenase
MGRKKLVIIGGGFAGLDVAREIGRSRDARAYWDAVLIDKENFFQFNPLLPSVAVGAVETRHIVYPLREMAQHHHVRFQKNKAIRVDLDKREILLHNNLTEPYDTLVISAGSVTNYYGVPGAQQYTRPFKTISDAMYVRARVVELFEMAEQAETVEQRRRLLSFVIVGGGVTGAEVAAELTEMARETLLPRYPHLKRDDISIIILEGGDRIVPTARPKHSKYIHRFLERHGVQIELKAAAKEVEDKRVIVSDGRAFDGFTILWTAGVTPPDFVQELPLQHIRDGRVRVDDHLRALKPDGTPLENLYALGDCAAAMKKDGTYQPALSQTGIAMGTYVGEALVRQAKGEATKPFAFQDAGYIISLGKHSSVVDLFGIPVSGKIAWLLWAAAYLVKMVGFRKQIEVGIDHITHLFFEHDTSQILNRRAVLSDEELNLSLAATQHSPDGHPPRGPAASQGQNEGVAPADLPEYLRGS